LVGTQKVGIEQRDRKKGKEKQKESLRENRIPTEKKVWGNRNPNYNQSFSLKYQSILKNLSGKG
jgi:hypothetical protein